MSGPDAAAAPPSARPPRRRCRRLSSPHPAIISSDVRSSGADAIAHILPPCRCRGFPADPMARSLPRTAALPPITSESGRNQSNTPCRRRRRSKWMIYADIFTAYARTPTTSAAWSSGISIPVAEPSSDRPLQPASYTSNRVPQDHSRGQKIRVRVARLMLRDQPVGGPTLGCGSPLVGARALHSVTRGRVRFRRGPI